MKPEKWDQIKELFSSALEREPTQRSAFLHEACGGDHALRAEVESLLSSYSQPNSFLEKPAVESTLDASAESLTGRRIGSYQVVHEIGSGGMAVVYLAMRADDQYRKRVAIKVVKKGVDLDEVPRRFRNERQTLAALDHPNIVKLLDGGSTEAGLPYLVMDYVEGMPITAYCDSRRLSITERLGLFRIVCGAVHYAHQNLIIHRDLKPGNILVTAEGVPKLLDFGIAKLLNPEFSAQTLLVTQTDQRLMTPEYASPEQVRGQPVTTATDVYSLGVLLYELLTGHRPYRLRDQTLHEIERVICEVEPEKPSTVVTHVPELLSLERTTQTDLTPELVSQTREGRPEKLRRRLLGDLDNVVLKALRKEPQRRYASVEQLSQDVRRHLEGLPVTARPATLGYRTSKFIQRHTAGVAAAVLVTLALVSGIVATTREARVARNEKVRAERRFNDVRQLADSFLFEFHDAIQDLPGSTQARKLVVRKALEYLDSLAQEAAGDRALQNDLAQAYTKVGDVQGYPYRPNLGDLAGALESYRKAQAITELLSRSDPKDDAAAHLLAQNDERIGLVVGEMGQAREAIDSLQKAQAIYEKLSSAHPENLQTRLDLAACYNSLADRFGHDSFRNLGNIGAALDYYRRSLAIGESIVATDPKNRRAHRTIAVAYSKIGYSLLATGDLKGAMESRRKSLATFAALADDPTNAVARRELSVADNEMGNTLWEMGDRKGALEFYRKGQAIAEALSAADPTNALTRFDLALSFRNIADAQVEMKDIRGAIQNYRKAVALVDEISAADPTNLQRRSELFDGLLLLGGVLTKAGQAEEARRATSRGLGIALSLAERPETLPRELNGYAVALLTCEPADLRNPAAALRIARRAAELTQSADPAILGTFALAYYLAGDPSHAIETEEKALSLLKPSEEGSVSAMRAEYEANLSKFKKGLKNRWLEGTSSGRPLR